MNKPSIPDWKETLLKSIDMIFDDKNTYFEKPKTAFSRIQKISIWDTMLFPMVASNESTPVELLDYFASENLPSHAAISYRRDQLKVSAYKAVLDNFTSKLPQNESFNGMQVIACDGTRVNTPYNPRDKKSFVPPIKDRKGFNQYHLVTCYDVKNEIFTDAVIQDYHEMNEPLAFCSMIDRYRKDQKVVFVADRGFSSFNVMTHVINNGHSFLIRLTATMANNIFKNTQNLKEVDECDIEDTYHVGRVRNKESKKLSNYHFIKKTKRYDSIDIDSDKIESFNVRLVKFLLPSGNAEYLITNLPKGKFPLKDLRELYRLRWGIETSFRYLKYASGMVHMHSIKPKFIFQEIFAKLTLYNFCTAVKLCTNVKNTEKTKHTYVIEKNYLIKVCIRFLRGVLGDILKLIEKRKVPVRENRQFERNLRSQHASTLQNR